LGLLWALTRAWKFAIFAWALAFGLVAMLVRLELPQAYSATEQLLFDPAGLRIFANDAGPKRYDANSEIDFVESQMGIIRSERVLSRVIDRECKLIGAPEPEKVEPPSDFQRLCGGGGAQDSARAIDGLRKLVVVKRAERSYLVDVTATSSDPRFAAQLASDLVDAYIDEDAATRTATADRLTSELHGRLGALRETLSQTEAKAEKYRGDANLARVGDKLLIEQKLSEAATALGAARIRWDRASARVGQLENMPVTATGLGALGDDVETRTLARLLDRRAAADAELAPLESQLGDRNPELIEARSRVARIDRDIAAETKSIRAAARDELDRATRERDDLAREVDGLTKGLAKAREAEITLGALQQSADANRKLLQSFEDRAHEAAETGRIDLANLRIASKARPPDAREAAFGVAAWAVAGFGLGLCLAMSFVSFISIWRSEAPPPPRGRVEGFVR
jgi:uncharacterized protein involved in exopolysaccharide biosynthesis